VQLAGWNLDPPVKTQERITRSAAKGHCPHVLCGLRKPQNSSGL
jgi:hypothetical protein